MSLNKGRALVCGLLMVGLIPAWGLESDRKQPMALEADSLSINESTGVSLYEGNVTIVQGSMKLWADRLWVHRSAGKTEKIVSEGEPTRFSQLPEVDGVEVHGRARRIEIHVDRNEMLLIDDALLEQGGNSFRNDRIVYNRANAQVRAGSSVQGKQRVQVVIEPQSGKTEP
ncbi:MAG: lipopolysaccharide transport periplasmic protein LptA [Chromatiales bacterium]|nr:lipopolysaccharide transport periplasmic protein LptA [Chromatiales bacterium]